MQNDIVVKQQPTQNAPAPDTSEQPAPETPEAPETPGRPVNTETEAQAQAGNEARPGDAAKPAEQAKPAGVIVIAVVLCLGLTGLAVYGSMLAQKDTNRTIPAASEYSQFGT